MFKDKPKLDSEQFKQYFIDELASENQQTQLETAFAFYENLAQRRSHMPSLGDSLHRQNTSNGGTKSSKNPLQSKLTDVFSSNNQKRQLSDVDLYKIIELPCFNILYDDVSAIVKTIS